MFYPEPGEPFANGLFKGYYGIGGPFEKGLERIGGLNGDFIGGFP